MSRTRTKKPIAEVGNHKQNGFAGQTLTAFSSEETIVDEVLPGNGHKLTINKYTFRGKYPVMNGVYRYAARNYTVTNFPVGKFVDPKFMFATHLPVGGSPTIAQAAAEIAAMTNPSRPLVDFPVFAVELKELPSLLFKRTNDIGRDISTGRLSLEYGWKPLISDLLSLLTFKDEFQKRVSELRSLRESGLRRKRIVFRGTSTVDNTPPTGDIVTNESGLVVRATSARVSAEVVTGWVKWMPDQVIPRHLGLQNDSIHQKAFFALLGLNPYVIDASTIWELLPYSWLVDWCTNMGDLLAANRNIVGAHIEEILVMRHTVTEQKVRLYPGSTTESNAIYEQCKPSREEFTRYRETKTRDPASLTFEAHMPFLDERKVMILSDIVRNNFTRSKIQVR